MTKTNATQVQTLAKGRRLDARGYLIANASIEARVFRTSPGSVNLYIEQPDAKRYGEEGKTKQVVHVEITREEWADLAALGRNDEQADLEAVRAELANLRSAVEVAKRCLSAGWYDEARRALSGTA